MRNQKLKWTTILAVVLTVGALLAATPAVFADDEVTVAVTGDMTPGGVVTATATINDGSTLQSVEWTQIEGVTAALSGADTLAVTATLGDAAAYKAQLITALEEPPISEADLPPNVDFPEGVYEGGLMPRWGVVATNPLALEHTSAVVLEATVVTDTGTYVVEADIATTIKWKICTGNLNAAVGIPVVMNSAEQSSYDWQMTAPAGSAATLADADTAHPDFTPDVAGKYSLSATDEESGDTVTVDFYAGTWVGVIEGQDGDGNPIVTATCTACHADGSIAPDMFTP